MFDTLESRRLMAASATLKDGVLSVTGTDNSDKIQISAAFTLKVNDDKTATNAVSYYTVNVNGDAIGSFRAGTVKRVNVFALGGNDSVIGPTGGVGQFTVLPAGGTRDESKPVPVKSNGHGVIFKNVGGTDSSSDTQIIRSSSDNITVSGSYVIIKGGTTGTSPNAPMYVEGGSGSDYLQGGSGNDTLKGGRGDDVLIGGAGKNVLDGGAGDDTFNAILQTIPDSTGKKVITQLDANGRNKVTGGAGRDFASLGRLDVTSPDTESRGYTTPNRFTKSAAADELRGLGDFLTVSELKS